jgi:hypothetical protein
MLPCGLALALATNSGCRRSSSLGGEGEAVRWGDEGAADGQRPGRSYGGGKGRVGRTVPVNGWRQGQRAHSDDEVGDIRDRQRAGHARPNR